MAVGAGIGLFIAFLGFKNAGIIVGDDATLIAIGDLTSPVVLLSVFGIFISVILLTLNFKGGIFYGMILTSIVGMLTEIGRASLGKECKFRGWPCQYKSRG